MARAEGVQRDRGGKTREVIVRCSDGRFKRIRTGRKGAIEAHCVECLGWEDNPASCTEKLCPLYPWRGSTRLTKTGNLATPEE